MVKKKHHFELSPGKSSATLIASWPKGINARLKTTIDRQQKPEDTRITLDFLLFFNQHAKNIRDKLKK